MKIPQKNLNFQVIGEQRNYDLQDFLVAEMVTRFNHSTMKATYFFDHAGKVILISFDGIMILEKLYAAIRFLWTLEGYNPNYDQIVDNRRAQMKMSAYEMTDLSVFMRESDLGLKAKAAIVIGVPSNAALSEIYGHRSRENHATQVCTSESEAIRLTGASKNIYKGLSSEAAIHKEF